MDGRRCAAPWCSGVLSRKADETSSNYRKRRYCNKRCAAKHANYRRNRKRQQEEKKAQG